MGERFNIKLFEVEGDLTSSFLRDRERGETDRQAVRERRRRRKKRNSVQTLKRKEQLYCELSSGREFHTSGLAFEQ